LILIRFTKFTLNALRHQFNDAGALCIRKSWDIERVEDFSASWKVFVIFCLLNLDCLIEQRGFFGWIVGRLRSKTKIGLKMLVIIRRVLNLENLANQCVSPSTNKKLRAFSRAWNFKESKINFVSRQISKSRPISGRF
jgi:hypothetical protein